jgi:Fe-S cluster assembly iron-binding protein IscA
MLALTDNAADAIRTIVESSDLDDRAGLRFSIHSVTEDEAELAVTLAPEASAGDEEVEVEGAHVYLDEAAAAMLQDKILDAEVTEDGEVGFSFGDQLSENGGSAEFR